MTDKIRDPETEADSFDPSRGGYNVTWEKYCALLAERDRYKARAERAEGVLRWLDMKIEEHCTHTGNPARIKDEKGDWHSGPAAEICQKVLRALQKLSRDTLAQIDAEPAEPRQPTVKTLAWEESNTGDLICDTIVGRYQIQKGSSRWCCMYAMGVKHSKSNLPTWHKGPFSAKDAAQADYERRILSALAEGDIQ